MNLKAIIVIAVVTISLTAYYFNYQMVAGQIQQLNTTDTDTLKSITNYDKILRSIIDECSVKSMSVGNEMTLEERIGCINIIDKMIQGN